MEIATIPDCGAEDQREACHNCQKYCANKGNLIEYLHQEIRGRLAGTIAHYKAAVFLEVIGNFNRVKPNDRIEICKTKDE